MKSSTLRCPNPQCRVTLMIPGEMVGQKVRCADCGHSFVVPMVHTSRPAKKHRYRKAS